LTFWIVFLIILKRGFRAKTKTLNTIQETPHTVRIIPLLLTVRPPHIKTKIFFIPQAPQVSFKIRTAGKNITKERTKTKNKKVEI
jgi:hypothetical protein